MHCWHHFKVGGSFRSFWRQCNLRESERERDASLASVTNAAHLISKDVTKGLSVKVSHHASVVRMAWKTNVV